MKNRTPIIVALCLIGIAVVSLFVLRTEPWRSVAAGVLSSALVVLFIELIDARQDRRDLGFLKGKYKRVEIKNKLREPAGDCIYEDITSRYDEKGVTLDLNLTYDGDGKYEGTAHYEEGRAKVSITLDQLNPNSGAGIYQYVNKIGNHLTPDLGTYRIQVDCTDRKRIYVYFQNTLPSCLAAGYEIWERVKPEE